MHNKSQSGLVLDFEICENHFAAIQIFVDTTAGLDFPDHSLAFFILRTLVFCMLVLSDQGVKLVSTAFMSTSEQLVLGDLTAHTSGNRNVVLSNHQLSIVFEESECNVLLHDVDRGW